MDFLKNKFAILGIVVLIVVFSGIGVFVLTQKKEQTQPEQKEESILENVKEIKAEDIGLVLTPRADGKAINMEIGKTDGILSFEYEVNYEAEGDIPRGVIGTVEVDSPEKTIKRKTNTET